MIRVLGLLLALGGILHAQDWTPTRIVAITDYGALARTAKISGDVVIRCVLSGDGSVSQADVVSGPPIFREQTQRNALLWKFHKISGASERNESVTLIYQYRVTGEPEYNGRTHFSVDLPNIVHITTPPPIQITLDGR